MTASYKLNNVCNGIEIYFSCRPEEQVLNQLKGNKWRWNKKKGCWYHYQSEGHKQEAATICSKINYRPIISSNYEKSTTYGANAFDPNSWEIESILRKQGYTVSQTEDLTRYERQRILSQAIINHVMTAGEIIQHISNQIRLREGNEKYDEACSRWRSDIEFVRGEFL